MSHDSLLRYGFDEIKPAIELDRTVNANSAERRSSRRREQEAHAAYLCFFFQIDIISPTIQLFINGIPAIWNRSWTLLASSLIDKLGRRYASSSIRRTRRMRLRMDDRVHLLVLYKGLAFTQLIVSYTAGILPHLHAKGLNAFNSGISWALIFKQYGDPIALSGSASKAFSSTSTSLETKNLSIEAAAALLDSEERVERLAQVAGVAYLAEGKNDGTCPVFLRNSVPPPQPARCPAYAPSPTFLDDITKHVNASTPTCITTLDFDGVIAPNMSILATWHHFWALLASSLSTSTGGASCSSRPAWRSSSSFCGDPPVQSASEGVFDVFNFIISLASISNQYVNPIALKWKYHIVYLVWLAFEGAFICFNILETKNFSLEETAALFEGDSSKSPVSRISMKARMQGRARSGYW
ncbi:hypothetical protein FIBSPDRAFT_1048087 [Athelia psychrophila]|uniref:Uncharacterized protein n=1 Tax=Athelia psychrophila TaxID=1759441 RepID=A0A166E635_9AGAM|nr:hypothetical protein FIBSPDRAFT_1048087 [Fibularhizoctonia sp. CBS 109695]